MDDVTLPARTSFQPALGARLSSDEALARIIARGSTWAFGLLYRRHHQSLYRYCRAIVHSEQDAEDVLQNAMLRAFRALQSAERDIAVRPWLFRIARNEAIEVLRQRSRDARLHQQLTPGLQAAEQPAERREQIATLIVDLRALTERQRSALLMRELSGLSAEEIAAAMSISPGAAKQAIFEARCALQEFGEGRAMACEEVRRLISDGDRRVLRGRKVAAHLRACSTCREFREAIPARGHALQAFAPPLPAAAAWAVLQRVLLHTSGGANAAGVATASRLALGKPAAASIALKGVAGAAAVAVVATGGARLALTGASHSHRHGGPKTGALAAPGTATQAAAGSISVLPRPLPHGSAPDRTHHRTGANKHGSGAPGLSRSSVTSPLSPPAAARPGLGKKLAAGHRSAGPGPAGGVKEKRARGKPVSQGKRSGSVNRHMPAATPRAEARSDTPRATPPSAGSGAQGKGARPQGAIPVVAAPAAQELSGTP